MHLGQHPKAGCSSLETSLSGRLTDLAGVPSLFRTIRSYYYTPGGLWVERCSKIAVEPTGYAYSFSQQPFFSRSNWPQHWRSERWGNHNLRGRMQFNIETTEVGKRKCLGNAVGDFQPCWIHVVTYQVWWWKTPKSCQKHEINILQVLPRILWLEAGLESRDGSGKLPIHDIHHPTRMASKLTSSGYSIWIWGLESQNCLAGQGWTTNLSIFSYLQPWDMMIKYTYKLIYKFCDISYIALTALTEGIPFKLCDGMTILE